MTAATTKQRLILLEALAIAPVHTIEARDRLGIASPAPRIFEARRLGLDITTSHTTVVDALGHLHTVALYTWNRRPGEVPL
jgi:hypothetical protein